MDACQQIIHFLILSSLLISSPCISSNNFSYINLPESHLSFYFNNYPNVAAACKLDKQCPYREWLNEPDRIVSAKRCWGYEDNCQPENAFAQPKCDGKGGGIGDEQKLINTFYAQADFGKYLLYVALIDQFFKRL